MGRILIVRGGAIGDFILTLPAIGLLREAFPETHLEILGYKHIVALADGRYYAHATRSIEYAGLATFFARGAVLPDSLVAYFASFQQVISYLYDPDGFFEANLRRAGVKNFIAGFARIEEGPEAPHAAFQLARPLEKLALFLGEASARLHSTADDEAFTSGFISQRFGTRPFLAVHPGSGGRHKLWPLERWCAVLETVRSRSDSPALLLVGGEADGERIEALRHCGDSVAWNLPLPHLAAVIRRCCGFVGHDSGISHLAAAASVPCLLLFGPTNPAIWAPAGDRVRVLHAASGNLETLSTETVLEQLQPMLANPNPV